MLFHTHLNFQSLLFYVKNTNMPEYVMQYLNEEVFPLSKFVYISCQIINDALKLFLK